MARPKKVDLEPEMWLTQFGEWAPGEPCRDHLRSDIGETDMSMILGEVDAVAASLIVLKRVSGLAYVRHTLVGMLREAAFVVEHTPTPFNPHHVSVYAPPGVDGSQLEWDDGVADLYRQCFDSAMDTDGEVADDQTK